MASVSQWEREVIGERTKDALRHKKGNGERVGTVPFRFHLAADGVHLEENPQEREILARIVELRGAGYTLRAIADELNRQGLKTRRGSAWRNEYVLNILKAA
jgi:site-specific DNA recombinase